MPTYDFICPVCNKIVEKLVKVDDPKPLCPDCSTEMKIKFSSTHHIVIH